MNQEHKRKWRWTYLSTVEEISKLRIMIIPSKINLQTIIIWDTNLSFPDRQYIGSFPASTIMKLLMLWECQLLKLPQGQPSHQENLVSISEYEHKHKFSDKKKEHHSLFANSNFPEIQTWTPWSIAKCQNSQPKWMDTSHRNTNRTEQDPTSAMEKSIPLPDLMLCNWFLMWLCNLEFLQPLQIQYHPWISYIGGKKNEGKWDSDLEGCWLKTKH